MGKEEKKRDTVILTREDHVATITLNRPEKLNAVGPHTMEELASALEEVAEDESVRAMILAGAGKAFCVGADFQEAFELMVNVNYADWQEQIVKRMIRIYKGVSGMPKPVIVAIQGHAVGGGMDIASACDIRIAADNAQFGEFFVRNAINPEACVFFMPRLIPLGQALLYSFTGDLMSAQEAYRIGFVEKVVPLDQLMPTAKELATKLANGPTMAIAAIKRLMRDALETNNLDVTLQSAFDAMFRLLQTEDFKEIVKAFSEKRKPVYKGR
jgi:enoyl-CoA hydratase/carnithine racemase